jgi:hypothetical protein
MRNVRVKIVDCAVVTFVNDKGEHVVLPLYAHEGTWRTFGAYQVYGISRSDPMFSAVHALPYRWKPTRRILRAIQRNR